MTLNIYWRLDPAADPQRSEPRNWPLPALARDRRVSHQNRFDYYLQVGQAAAQTAFDGLFVRHRIEADESRIIAAIVARAVPRLTVVAEFPVSVGSAVYAAKQATTFQRSTHGRLGWAIAPDAEPAIRKAEADFVDEDDLGRRLDEFLTVARGVHQQRPFSYKGAHFEVENGGFDAPLNRVPFPRIFLQGEGEQALAVSTRHADVHLFQPAPADALAHGVARLQALTGGRIGAGLIQPLLIREDKASAERDAKGRDLAPGTLLASYDEAAEQLAGIVHAGISELVLEAGPSLEEAYRIGQHLLPRLRELTATVRAAA
ncbi:LLM class flavin-dependent oxidoreductase [Sphingobium agri]|uniref:LLM class flavin-dependent oxidoreductase n=1 Tax=Sphingobium agri TaxID=2933566 RepID=A0ABT0DZ36_9SPHN|nr:LLM class flavin-dependent oxidoreductase [Sphingobium agri]MCK0532338.1 LLM class flavin-dependent oxidoreductase [Sphingobium agri]